MLRLIKTASVMFAVLLVVFAAKANAQETKEPVYTLQECINTALKNNSALRNAGYSYDAAEMDVLSSFKGILPSLSVSAGRGEYETGPAEYLSNEPVGLDEDGNVIYELRTRKTELTTRKSTTAGFDLNQTIFDGGIWWNQIRKARVDQKASKYNFESQRNNTILQVQTSYFDLIKQIKMLEVYDLAVKRSKAQLDRTSKMYELGAVAKVDIFRAKVNLGNDRINYLQQKNTVEQSRKNLNLTMGRDPFTPLNVKIEVQREEPLPDINEMVKTAYEHQPLIKKDELSIRSSALSAALAKGLNFPRLSAYISYNRFHENAVKVFSDFGQNYSTQYGIRLSFNIFNGFSDYANVQKAEISRKAAMETYEEYKRTLKASVHQYYADYISTLDIIKINQENLEAAKEEMRLEEERYMVGAGTALEVREAQVNLTRAEETLIATQFTASLILAQLDNQLGLTYQKVKE